VLRRELDFRPNAAGGHSLGEYTALLAAGALSLSQAVKLVKVRGELMQSAVPVGRGKMAAIIGMQDTKVVELCELATEGLESIVVAANFNAPMQVVIAGHSEAVDRAAAILDSPDHPEMKAKRFVPLKVSAPFHSPLMKPVADAFLPFLEAVSWEKLSFPVVFNFDAKIRTDTNIASLLKDQVDHPVLWTDCIKNLFESGHGYFLESGPGKVLTGLLKRIVKEAKGYSVDSMERLRSFEAVVKEER